MRMVDCQGLAGTGTTLGGVLAGFDLVHRVALPGGFGNKLVEENRKILNFTGDIETGPIDEWTPQHNIAMVTGTPPCSGFSLMNTTGKVAENAGKEAPATARGPGSLINMCQRDLVRYGARCFGTDGNPGAEFVVFESVQGAFSQGLELMREYWQILRRETGQDYQMSHIKMSVASIGGAQLRHRYFWVAHRIPFGIDFELPKRITTLEDAIGDLVDQPELWEPQDYVSEAKTDYQRNLRGKAVVNHESLKGKHYAGMEPLEPYWPPGKAIHTATLAYIEAHGGGEKGVDALPEHLKKRWQPEAGYYKGFMWPFRLGWDEPSGVLTGGCAGSHIHPDHPRFMTIRELARMMAVPDDWTFNSARHAGEAGSWIGKACTVGSAVWLSSAIMDALDGRPQSDQGEFWSHGLYKKNKLDLADGERVYDITNEYRKFDGYYRHKR
jgi:site-specific DNA-cytosine methylase